MSDYCYHTSPLIGYALGIFVSSIVWLFIVYMITGDENEKK